MDSLWNYIPEIILSWPSHLPLFSFCLLLILWLFSNSLALTCPPPPPDSKHILFLPESGIFHFTRSSPILFFMCSDKHFLFLDGQYSIVNIAHIIFLCEYRSYFVYTSIMSLYDNGVSYLMTGSTRSQFLF